MNNYRLMESYLFVLQVTAINSYIFQQMNITWWLLSLVAVSGAQWIEPKPNPLMRPLDVFPWYKGMQYQYSMCK